MGYPVGSSDPGAYRGACSADSGVPADVEVDQAKAHVKFSDIKFGPIGSTTGASFVAAIFFLHDLVLPPIWRNSCVITSTSVHVSSDAFSLCFLPPASGFACLGD